MVLRSRFRLMKPLRHHHDPVQSEVLAHIAAVLECDLVRAERSFNSMRNIKSRVLLFDGQSRTWRGCDWVPDDKEAAIRELQFQVVKLQADIRYIKKLIGGKRKVTSKKSKLKEEVAYLTCACGARGFQSTDDVEVFRCKNCNKTTKNNGLVLYNLWDINNNKIINNDGI